MTTTQHQGLHVVRDGTEPENPRCCDTCPHTHDEALIGQLLIYLDAIGLAVVEARGLD